MSTLYSVPGKKRCRNPVHKSLTVCPDDKIFGVEGFITFEEQLVLLDAKYKLEEHLYPRSEGYQGGEMMRKAIRAWAKKGLEAGLHELGVSLRRPSIERREA